MKFLIVGMVLVLGYVDCKCLPKYRSCVEYDGRQWNFNLGVLAYIPFMDALYMGVNDFDSQAEFCCSQCFQLAVLNGLRCNLYSYDKKAKLCRFYRNNTTINNYLKVSVASSNFFVGVSNSIF
jgi:hypothetical protein